MPTNQPPSQNPKPNRSADSSRQSQPDKGLRKEAPNYMRYANMGFQMVVIIGLGVYAGIKLDEKLHLKVPVFTIILSFVSVAAAIYFVVRDLLKK